jgi:succinate-semialdehyde dehydrogenase / glutarate-semialdehyde dehydrogenase
LAVSECLLARLRAPSLLPAAGFVGAHLVECSGDGSFEVVNPSTGETLASLPEMGVNHTRSAIDSAYDAQQEWATRTAKERSAVMRTFNNLILENIDDLATILTMEMGKPFAEARGEILYGASYIEWFAEEAKRVYGDVVPGQQADKRVLVIKQPVGVVAVITPWNFPNAMLARKLAPALSVGCAVVAKPAEQTPLSAIALAVLARRAGVPDGVFNLIVGTDGPAIGKEICANPKVRKISFTGSTQTGRILMRQAADNILRMSMELGGNAPFIVFADADIDVAVEGAMAAKFRNAGQTCVCANRMYVHASIYDEFADKLTEKTGELKLGDGFCEDVTTGPLIDEQGLAKVVEHVGDAVEKGAKILAGGGQSELGGLFFQPTVLRDARADMKIAREETFGPVAPLFRFDTEAEVIRQANDTEFGLAAYLFARDLSQIWRVAEALEFGMIGINTGVMSNEMAPFGGIKQSGQGREGSRYGIDDYLELKYLCLGGI